MPVACASQQIDGGMGPPSGDLVGGTDLDNGLLDIHAERGVEGEAAKCPGATGIDAQRSIEDVIVETQPTAARLGIAHPRHAIEMLQDLEGTDVDVGGPALDGRVAVQAG